MARRRPTDGAGARRPKRNYGKNRTPPADERSRNRSAAPARGVRETGLGALFCEHSLPVGVVAESWHGNRRPPPQGVPLPGAANVTEDVPRRGHAASWTCQHCDSIDDNDWLEASDRRTRRLFQPGACRPPRSPRARSQTGATQRILRGRWFFCCRARWTCAQQVPPAWGIQRARI